MTTSKKPKRRAVSKRIPKRKPRKAQVARYRSSIGTALIKG